MRFAVILLAVGALQSTDPQERFFESNGVPIRFVEQGQGPAVVLIHGYTGTADRHWINTGVFGDLARDHRVIAMDARGHGKSGKPREASAYGAEMSRDVVRLLDHLEITHAHVVGFSMGAFVAGHLMVTQPDRLITVTLVAQHPIRHWTNVDEQEAEASARDLESETPFRSIITAVAPPDARPSEEEIRSLSAKMTAANDPKALAAYYRGLRTLAVTDADLSDVRLPVQAVIGSEDPATKGVRELRRVLPQLLLKVVEGATHGGERGILRRVEFRAALRAFLASHRQSSHEEIRRIVAGIQRADYEGDRPTLARLYEELGRFAEDRRDPGTLPPVRKTPNVLSAPLQSSGSAACLERQHLRIALVREDCFQASPPEVQRGPLLRVVAVPIVNGSNARLDVIQDLRHDEPRHTGADHEAGRGAPQVVPPELHA